jgi:hypothetical protein
MQSFLAGGAGGMQSLVLSNMARVNSRQQVATLRLLTITTKNSDL